MLKHAVTHRSNSSLGENPTSPRSYGGNSSQSTSRSSLPYIPIPSDPNLRRCSMTTADAPPYQRKYPYKRNLSMDSYTCKIYPVFSGGSRTPMSSQLNKSMEMNESICTLQSNNAEQYDSPKNTSDSVDKLTNSNEQTENCYNQSMFSVDQRINELRQSGHHIHLNSKEIQQRPKYNFVLNNCPYSEDDRFDQRGHKDYPNKENSQSSKHLESSSCSKDQNTCHNIPLKRSVGLLNSFRRKGSLTYISSQHLQRKNSEPFFYPTFSPKLNNGNQSINENSMPRSCTLPRREGMLKNMKMCSTELNDSLTSLTSTDSYLSLNTTNCRSNSMSSLSDTVPVKIHLRRLRPDMEYKTLPLSLKATCKELVQMLLKKFRLRHRDPNLFYVQMEFVVRASIDGEPVTQQLILEDTARPAELQQCRPKGEANFSIGVKRGGLVRVHDSILMPGSQYKSMLIAYETTSEELVHLMLKCYNVTENPLNYALHELQKNPYKDRILNPEDCPLHIQLQWPVEERHNWAFVLRRNLTYAFRLKSQMNWRKSQEQGSTDTESEYDELADISSISLSSSPLSLPDFRSSVSSSSSVSSTGSSRSSDKSLDSGYIGSPFNKGDGTSMNVKHLSGRVPYDKSKLFPREIVELQGKIPPTNIKPNQSVSSCANSSFPNESSIPNASLSSPTASSSSIDVPPSISTPKESSKFETNKPQQKTTVITITSTLKTPILPPKNSNELICRRLKTITTPPSLKTTVRSPSGNKNQESLLSSQKPSEETIDDCRSKISDTKHVSFTQRRALSLPPSMQDDDTSYEHQRPDHQHALRKMYSSASTDSLLQVSDFTKQYKQVYPADHSQNLIFNNPTLLSQLSILSLTSNKQSSEDQPRMNSAQEKREYINENGRQKSMRESSVNKFDCT